MKVKVEFDIPDERISDLLCSAFEGGSGYWINGLKVARQPDTPVRYMSEVPMAGGALKIVPYDPENAPTPLLLNEENCRQGLRLLAQSFPKHIQDVIEENDDAGTGDAFLQMAVFGEIVFG
jgi:hypothetical protein